MILAFFTSSALAVKNCKCQDSGGQYNSLTDTCCDYEVVNLGKDIKYPGSNHQCWDNHLLTKSVDGGKFAWCCQQLGVGGAYCWN